MSEGPVAGASDPVAGPFHVPAPSRRYRRPFRAFAAFSAILALTTFFTNPAGIGASKENRIVPLPDR